MDIWHKALAVTQEVIREVLLFSILVDKCHNNNKICNSSSMIHQAITIRLASNIMWFTIQDFQWVWEDSQAFHLEQMVQDHSWVVINRRPKYTL